MLLEGKTAVVTGSNRGIGQSILEVFAENGADIWACARKPSEAFTQQITCLSKETEVSIFPVYFDLADLAQVKNGAETIISAKKPLDILVNNAGIVYNSLFQMTPVDKMEKVFGINVFSQLVFTQYIVKMMARQKSGSIINISSSAAFEGNEGRTAYAASKAAMVAATKVMSKELAGHNIRVNAIAPGLTMTEMMIESTSEDALEDILQQTCMKRVGRPEEIANVVLFLSSHLSSYMTGQILRVDGGM